MTRTSPTLELSRFFSTLELGRVPESVRREAKRWLLDTLGCIVAGAASPIAGLGRSLAAFFGGADEATAAGIETPVPLLAAAYANARMGNAMDFDETFPVGAHFGIGAAVAALSVGEAKGLAGRDVLLAAIAGYELGARVATATGPMVLVEDGRFVGYPDVWGVAAPAVMAAAGAAANALGLDAATTAQAYGLAGSNTPLPAGHKWATSVRLPNCKYCDAGWCTVTGLFAALSAVAGSTGFATILDGERGLLRMCGAARADPDLLTADLGNRWHLHDITYKPWPGCRFTHYPLTAFIGLVDREGLKADEIEEVVVRTNPLAASERFTNSDPLTFVERQYSYPHMMAMAALGVPVAEWLSDRWAADPRTQAFKRRVTVELHPRKDDVWRSMERNQLRRMPGGVRVRVGNRVLEAETDYALGDPWHPDTRFDDDRLIAKVRALVPPAVVDDVVAAVFDLENRPSIAPLASALRRIEV